MGSVTNLPLIKPNASNLAIKFRGISVCILLIMMILCSNMQTYFKQFAKF